MGVELNYLEIYVMDIRVSQSLIRRIFEEEARNRRNGDVDPEGGLLNNKRAKQYHRAMSDYRKQKNKIEDTEKKAAEYMKLEPRDLNDMFSEASYAVWRLESIISSMNAEPGRYYRDYYEHIQKELRRKMVNLDTVKDNLDRFPASEVKMSTWDIDDVKNRYKLMGKKLVEIEGRIPKGEVPNPAPGQDKVHSPEDGRDGEDGEDGDDGHDPFRDDPKWTKKGSGLMGQKPKEEPKQDTQEEPKKEEPKAAPKKAPPKKAAPKRAKPKTGIGPKKSGEYGEYDFGPQDMATDSFKAATVADPKPKTGIGKKKAKPAPKRRK